MYVHVYVYVYLWVCVCGVCICECVYVVYVFVSVWVWVCIWYVYLWICVYVYLWVWVCVCVCVCVPACGGKRLTLGILFDHVRAWPLNHLTVWDGSLLGLMNLAKTASQWPSKISWSLCCTASTVCFCFVLFEMGKLRFQEIFWFKTPRFCTPWQEGRLSLGLTFSSSLHLFSSTFSHLQWLDRLFSQQTPWQSQLEIWLNTDN